MTGFSLNTKESWSSHRKREAILHSKEPWLVSIYAGSVPMKHSAGILPRAMMQ
jgi:hypothetical protein